MVEELEGVGCKGGGWWRDLRGLGVRGEVGEGLEGVRCKGCGGGGT